MNSRETVWQWVRNRQISRQKFRREYPLPPYTADFCFVELKLILEVDGADHFTEAGRERDRVRDEALAREGYLVVRIFGFDVLREPERVCQDLEERVRERMRELGVIDASPLTPDPSPRGGERGDQRISLECPNEVQPAEPDDCGQAGRNRCGVDTKSTRTAELQ